MSTQFLHLANGLNICLPGAQEPNSLGEHSAAAIRKVSGNNSMVVVGEVLFTSRIYANYHMACMPGRPPEHREGLIGLAAHRNPEYKPEYPDPVKEASLGRMGLFLAEGNQPLVFQTGLPVPKGQHLIGSYRAGLERLKVAPGVLWVPGDIDPEVKKPNTLIVKENLPAGSLASATRAIADTIGGATQDAKAEIATTLGLPPEVYAELETLISSGSQALRRHFTAAASRRIIGLANQIQ